MFGLSKDTDLTFLIKRKIERIDYTDYQAQLYLTDSIIISIEGDCELNNESISYENLSQLVEKSIFGVIIQDDSSIILVFVDGNRLKILDSNSNYESYQIITPDIDIIV